MANLPPTLNLKAPPFEASGSSSALNKDRKMQSAEQLVLDLCNPDLRENALLELSKKRELFQDLAPLLWNSFGTVAALLQEIVSIYPVLSPPNLTPAQSNRVCNALALLQDLVPFIKQLEHPSLDEGYSTIRLQYFEAQILSWRLGCPWSSVLLLYLDVSFMRNEKETVQMKWKMKMLMAMKRTLELEQTGQRCGYPRTAKAFPQI